MIMPGHSDLDLPPISSRRVTSYAPHGTPSTAAGSSRRSTGPVPNGGMRLNMNGVGGADDTETIFSGTASGAAQPPTTRRAAVKFSDANASGRPKSSVRSRRPGVSGAPAELMDSSSVGVALGQGALFSGAGAPGELASTLGMGLSDTGSNSGVPVGQWQLQSGHGMYMRRGTSIDRLHQRFNPNLQQQAPLIPSSLDDFNMQPSSYLSSQSPEMAEENGTDVNSGLRMQVSPVRSHTETPYESNAEPHVQSSSQEPENVPSATSTTARPEESSTSSPHRPSESRPPPSAVAGTVAGVSERREYLSVATYSVAASSANKSLGSGPEINRTAGVVVGPSRSSVANRGSMNTGGSIANSGPPSTLPARPAGKVVTKTVSSPSILPSRFSQSTAPLGYAIRTNRNLSGGNVTAAASSNVAATVNGENTRRSEAPGSVSANAPSVGVGAPKPRGNKSELPVSERPRATSRLAGPSDISNGALRKERTTVATRNGPSLGGRAHTQTRIARGKEKEAENGTGAGSKQVRHVRDYNLLFNDNDDDLVAGAEENAQDGAGNNGAGGNDEDPEQQQDPQKRERIMSWLQGLESPSSPRSPDFHGAINGFLHAHQNQLHQSSSQYRTLADGDVQEESVHREYDAIPSSPTTPSLRDTAIHIVYDGPTN